MKKASWYLSNEYIIDTGSNAAVNTALTAKFHRGKSKKLFECTREENLYE